MAESLVRILTSLVTAVCGLLITALLCLAVMIAAVMLRDGVAFGLSAGGMMLTIAAAFMGWRSQQLLYEACVYEEQDDPRAGHFIGAGNAALGRAVVLFATGLMGAAAGVARAAMVF